MVKGPDKAINNRATRFLAPPPLSHEPGAAAKARLLTRHTCVCAHPAARVPRLLTTIRPSGPSAHARCRARAWPPQPLSSRAPPRASKT